MGERREHGHTALSSSFYISDLSEEIILEILSYIACGPFEETAYTVESTLTHTLPLVSTQFRYLCESNILWLASLQRLIEETPTDYITTLKSMLDCERKKPQWSVFYQEKVDKNDFMLVAKLQQIGSLNREERKQLIYSIYQSLYDIKDQKLRKETIVISGKKCVSFKRRRRISFSQSSSSSSIDDTVQESHHFYSGKQMYISIIKECSYSTFPVYPLRHPFMRLGYPITLTLLETRYRMLINEIMTGRRTFEFQGRKLESPRPKFICTFTGNLNPGVSAFLVELLHYKTSEVGRARIMIEPIEKVQLISFHRRQKEFNSLYDARIRRFRN